MGHLWEVGGLPKTPETQDTLPVLALAFLAVWLRLIPGPLRTSISPSVHGWGGAGEECTSLVCQWSVEAWALVTPPAPRGRLCSWARLTGKIQNFPWRLDWEALRQEAGRRKEEGGGSGVWGPGTNRLPVPGTRTQQHRVCQQEKRKEGAGWGVGLGGIRKKMFPQPQGAGEVAEGGGLGGPWAHLSCTHLQLAPRPSASIFCTSARASPLLGCPLIPQGLSRPLVPPWEHQALFPSLIGVSQDPCPIPLWSPPGLLQRLSGCSSWG